MKGTDVGIIGGGIHGVSAAYHLAARGIKPTLFDRGGVAGGPTGRSSAVCRAFYTNPFLARVAHEALEMFATFAEVSGGRECGYRRTGGLYLLARSDLDGAATAARMLAEVGTEIQLLVDDLAREHPELQLDDGAVGVWEPASGHADPVLATRGLFERALEWGLVAHLHTAVTSLNQLSGGGAVVTTSKGDRIECGRLLIAAGPWSKSFAAAVGVELPLTVERHFVATFGRRAPAVSYNLDDLPGAYYIRPEGPDLLLVGPETPESSADPDDFASSITFAEGSRMAGAISWRIPALTTADWRGGWASLYDVSPDWQPVIGEIASGVFIDAGTSGHGFKLAPALGRHVADLLCGAEVEPDLGQFNPGRFDMDRPVAAGFGAARIIG